MLDTSARLLRLLTLLQTRRFWSGHELAERLEITERTVRRDVERLKQLGYPVEGTPGVAGGYQMGAGASLPPLQLDDDEALAVSLGLFDLTSSSVSGMDEAALRALVKLERVLPSRLKKRAAALRAAIQPLTRPGPRAASDVLTLIASGVADHTELRFSYGDKTGTKSERMVDPAGLVHTGFRWYLVAWDQARQDWRTFRVDRIQAPVEAGKRFTPRPLPNDGDLRGYVSRSVAVAPYSVQARVLVHAPLAAVRARVSPSAAVLEPIDAACCRLIAGATAVDHLAAHLLNLGFDFEVEEPVQLRDHLATVHTRLGRMLEPKKSGAAEPPITISISFFRYSARPS